MAQDRMKADTPDLHRLIYFSRNRISGSPEKVAAEVEAILAASRKNNPAFHITGALIFNHGVFAQVLEGARHSIEVTFERIQRDPRHADVHVLAFEGAPQRSFPSWSMAFVGRSREGQNLFSHIGTATGFEDKRLEGEHVFSIMRAIALEEETSGLVR
jgi:hypothetical protein